MTHEEHQYLVCGNGTRLRVLAEWWLLGVLAELLSYPSF
jgi:hypothetical protein